MDAGRPSNLDQQRYYLTAVYTSVRAGELLARPELCNLAIEDIAWTVGFEYCSAREPHWWQLRKRREWTAELEGLLQERHRLQARAAELGLPS